MTTVAIATPHAGMVNPEYYRRVLAMQGQFVQHVFYHMEVDLQIVGKARNILVESSINMTDAEVFWFIDNDVLIPPEAGVLVEQALEYGVVSGLYFSRRSPYTPQMYRLCRSEEEHGMYEAIFDYPSKGFVKADGVGAGCLAVRRDVFLRLQDHFKGKLDKALKVVSYRVRYDREARESFEWLVKYSRNLSPWFEFLDRKGEDFYFCERCRDAGQMIWVNVGVKCEHVGQLAINEGHFQYLKENDLYIRLDHEGKPIERMLSGEKVDLPKPEVIK